MMQPAALSFESDHFTLHRLADGVFAAIATDGGAAVSNAGIIDLGGRTLIFDAFMTPQAARDLLAAARQLTGREPDVVVNSHYHNDHIWGNQVFGPQTLIISSSRTLQLMHTAGRDELKWANDVSANRFEDAKRQYESAPDDRKRRDALLWMGYFGGLVQALPSLAVRFPDVTFEDRLSLHGASRSAELIPFRNCHTEEDHILYLPDAGVVFMADLLFVSCHPYLDESDVSSLSRALKEISHMAAAVFVPGHGAVGAPADITSNLDYISMCLDRARALADQGNLSPERLAREAPPAPFASWGLSRFYTANLESLCAKLSSQNATA